MEQHIEDLLDIEDIASQSGLSRRQLERSFRAAVGTSPASAYLIVRLDAAMRLVKTTKIPLAEIAIRAEVNEGRKRRSSIRDVKHLADRINKGVARHHYFL